MANPVYASRRGTIVTVVSFIAGFFSCAILLWIFLVPLRSTSEPPKVHAVASQRIPLPDQKPVLTPKIDSPLVQIIHKSGQTIPIHDFFINYKPKGIRSPDEPTWTIPKAADFDRKDFHEVGNLFQQTHGFNAN